MNALSAKAPPVVTAVKMLDGRTVNFSGKKRLDKTIIMPGTAAELDAEGNESANTGNVGSLPIVRLDFLNGEVRVFKLTEALLHQFAAHGASQKLGDEISDVTDLDDAVEVTDQLMQRLDAGEWFANREGGSGLSGASVLAKALVEATGQTIAIVRNYLSGLDNKTKLALRGDPSVSAIIKRLEAEKAARAAERGKAAVAFVDTAGLLAKLKTGGVEPQSALPS